MATEIYLIPKELEEQLLQLRGDGDEARWAIGRIADVLEAEASGSRKQIAIIRGQIGALTGKTVNTIRDYRRVSAYWPEEVVEQYPTLTRDYFRVAMASVSIEEATARLEVAVTTADDWGGLVMPLDRFIAHVRGRTGDETPEEKALTLIEQAITKVQKAQALEVTDLGMALATLHDAVERIRRPRAEVWTRNR